MDGSAYVVVVVATLALSCRGIFAWRKSQRLKLAAQRHYQRPTQQSLGLKEMVGNGLEMMDSKLRIGLVMTALIELTRFAPERLQLWTPDSTAGAAISRSAKFLLLIGLVRTTLRLPLKKWFSRRSA
eukprot:TRINITY_DN17590_c0_g1_i1.p1 TRINITY_DN17590_c0_g1~~TRINITY_DN17590_c0_g1_i1.p1  ORF type:complete len:127 (+),score=16.98 TRINITY_DN17590_c0_g1_i1:60-440(+)